MDGIQLLSAGPTPNFWRAPIDNDFGNRLDTRFAMWKTFGKELTLQTLVPAQLDSMVVLVAEYIHPDNSSNYKVAYHCNSVGEVLVSVEFTPSADNFPGSNGDDFFQDVHECGQVGFILVEVR